MSLYHYTALGKKKGLIDALSLNAAKEKLREQGILVTNIWAKRGRPGRQRLKGQVLVNFTTQLAQLIGSGMPIFESLNALEEQYRDESYHRVLLNLCDQIKGGAPLSEAMASHPDSFDQLYSSMIAAGEASGSLPHVMTKLALLLNNQLKMRKQVVTALTYPSVIAGFCGVVIFLLLTFALPSMEALFGDGKLNSFTASVLSVSHFMSTYWPLYLPLIGGSVTGAIYFLRTAKGRNLWRRTSLKIPVIKGLVIQAALARFTRTLASLQEGGLTLIDSLRLSRKVVLNPTLEAIFERAEEKIIQGSSLSKELSNHPLLPRLIPRMLGVGEESGNLVPMLYQIADLYDGEVERTLSRATSLVQPAILIIMGGVVGLIMLAVLLPLTDVNSMF